MNHLFSRCELLISSGAKAHILFKAATELQDHLNEEDNAEEAK